MVIHSDCKHFRGDVPCKPHKQHGVHCLDCPHYAPQPVRVLIIKLGAIGDVIRTTPLLAKIRREYRDCSIWWLTRYPEVTPSDADVTLPFDAASLLRLQATPFNVIINLDKDYEACAVAHLLPASRKMGFTLVNGRTAPIDDLARHKFFTGLFDDLNKRNTRSYLEEIFEICGWQFSGEEYVLDVNRHYRWHLAPDGKPVIGLNTGCGGRWTSRLWSESQWTELIKLLQNAGYFPLLLGGEQEHEKNARLASRTDAAYLGHFPYDRFVSLMDQCDAVVSGVTMAMHIAVGLKKPLILFVNIFNPHEFELYGRGEIVQPERECQCFFQPTCSNKEYECMESLSAEKVFEAVKRAAPLGTKP